MGQAQALPTSPAKCAPVVYRLMCGVICIFPGTSVTYVEARDADDSELVFDIVGDAGVLAAGPLLRIVRDAQKRASVFLNSPLNAVVSLAQHHHHHHHHHHRHRGLKSSYK